MGYKVHFSMKPRKGVFKKKFGTLQMGSKGTYKTKSGARREVERLKKEQPHSRYEKEHYKFRYWVTKK